MTDIFVMETLRWIHQDNRAWFCYLSLNVPHFPLQQSEDWATPCLAKSLPERLAKFYGMISNLDSEVGRLLGKLKKTGESENTLVIFLGNNGTALGGDSQPGEYISGLRGTKGSPDQGGVRVPGQLCDLDLDTMPPVDGRSLAPILLTGKQPADWADRFLPTHVARWPSGTPVENLQFLNSSIRNQRHSLVNGSELYDLENDPGETLDFSEEQPGTLEKLRAGQGPVELTCMDCSPSRATREPLPPEAWDQESLREWNASRRFQGIDGGIGGWIVEAEAAGIYEFELRQRPNESKEIAAFLQGSAELEIDGKKTTATVVEGNTVTRLRAELPAGFYFLEPLITGQRPSGKPQGAYFCKISMSLQETP